MRAVGRRRQPWELRSVAALWLSAAVVAAGQRGGEVAEQAPGGERQAEPSAAERRLAEFTVEWVPALDVTPAGGGPPVLYAGTNYTSFILTSNEPVTENGRLILIDTTLHYSGAQAGHCLSDLYFVLDKMPPLDASIPFPGTGSTVEYNGGIMFSKGGTFKLCWSPAGNFGIGDGWLIPEKLSEFQIYGAIDTCDQGVACGMARRFFCYLPHVEYVIYGTLGTLCEIFMPYTNTPLVYSRLTWTEGATSQEFAMAELQSGLDDTPLRLIGGQCPGATVGPGLVQSDQQWIREVDPLSRISLGHTRIDSTKGFHYKLCFCPAYDASTDGVCGELSDFVQQVGYLDGLIISFLAARGEAMGLARSQVLAMTRFDLRLDCGDGPWCGTHGLGRVKVIAKSWDPIETNTDLPHWDDRNGCQDAMEVLAWHSPPNCIDQATGEKLPSHCLTPGGNDPYVQLFQDVRMLPLFESGVNVAQIYEVCFVHMPLEVDGTDPATFNRTSDLAMQNTTRTWWKVGQLVVEPLFLLNPWQYIIHTPAEIRVAPLHRNRSSTMHDDFPELPADGADAHGPILKLVHETVVPVDNAICATGRPSARSVRGLSCPNASYCLPRAVKEGEELVLSGGDPAHLIEIQRAGVYAVCYCEKFGNAEAACEDPTEWMLVGKMIVAGPRGEQEWVLDKGIIQSFDVIGFGFSDENSLRDGKYGPYNTVRILANGQGSCAGAGNNNLATTSLKVCSPVNKGRCQYHSMDDSVGVNDSNISDIPGVVWRYNSVYPPAYIKSLTPDPGGGPSTVATFAQISVLTEGDTIHFEDNIEPHASHWRRKADLEGIITGAGRGHDIVELMDAGRQARIPMSLDPFPPLTITPPESGRWWRSNRLKVGNIKGIEETPPLLVCWGVKSDVDEEATYYEMAGYISWVNPNYFTVLDVGLTSTSAGTIAPLIISFTTGDNPMYLEARNAMQLRVCFTNTSVLAFADSSVHPKPLEHLYDADQQHEASQAVCGMLFVEMWSSHEFGFPVPRGCWVDFNRYGAEGRVQAIYMIFTPLNGLKRSTQYQLVMNVHLRHAVDDYTGLSEDPGLVEVTALDDMMAKPEGVVDIQWANPDKPIQDPAVRHLSRMDSMFRDADGQRGGITVRQFAFERSEDDDTVPSEDFFVRAEADSFGMVFLLKGSEVNPIRQNSIIRIFFWPLTLWSFGRDVICQAECVPQRNRECRGFVGCEFEAAQSICRDFVPPKLEIWRDTRGRACDFYAQPTACVLDGTSYTPVHGHSALDSCCVCGGGVRYNKNIVKLSLPTTMESAYGYDIIHTIRVWNLAPMPPRGFFATRFGAQVSTKYDTSPHYITTTGKYITRTPNETIYNPVATLVDAEGWGNQRQFKGEPRLNDYYLRLQMPASLYGAPWTGNGYLTRVDIWLPEGFICVLATRVEARGEGDDKIDLPVLPLESPTGKGGFPQSTDFEGGNLTTPGAGYRSGKWAFAGNQCTFHFERYMALHDKQRLYVRLFVYNPRDPLPRTDPKNFWLVSFTSSGHSGAPADHREVCRPYFPPFCNDTGETYYVNPLGLPMGTRTLEPLYPDERTVSRTFGPWRLGLPLNRTAEPDYTVSLPVLGIVEDLIVQPTFLLPGTRSRLQFWFSPDLGALERGGFLGIQAPEGFDFGDPCSVRDLPPMYYSVYSPPLGHTGFAPWTELDPRVFPVEDMGECTPAPSPRWSRGGSYVTVKVHGSFVPGRRYGFEIDVEYPPAYNFSKGFQMDADWTFKISITDGMGYGRDGTYTTAAFFPNTTISNVVAPPTPPMYLATVQTPIIVLIDEMQPYTFRPYLSRVEVEPILFDRDVVGPLQVTAPEGYEWVFTETDFAASLNGTVPMPGGIPTLHPDGRPNVIAWLDPDVVYLANTPYAFATYVKVPSVPPRASANAFFFQWGFGFNSTGPEHLAVARSPAPQVRALRGLRVEMTDTNRGSDSRIWVWVETVTDISHNGSLEIGLPMTYEAMQFSNTTLYDGPYCSVHAVQEYGSLPLPPDLMCRSVFFPEPVLRLVLFANETGLPAGRYVFEFNVTNPDRDADNPAAASSPCGSRECVEVHTKELCGSFRAGVLCPGASPPLELATEFGPWVSLEPAGKSPLWKWENDYWTTIKAPRITTPMDFAEIVNLTLDERLAANRDDRPLRRTAVVIAMRLRRYAPTRVEDLVVRAPIGWHFDSVCDMWTQPGEVYPPPLPGEPAQYLKDNTTAIDVHAWPSSAEVLQCRGYEHIAIVTLTAGLQPGRLYLFRIGMKRNPIDTPWRRNTWSLTYGPESSGSMPGFRVATFPFASLDPILLAWTDKADPMATPVGIRFNITNNLIAQEHHGKLMYPMIRVVMPPLFEAVVDAESQDIQGGTCYVVLMELGTCRLCNVPFFADTLRCRREWNRKNAFMVTLLNEEAWLYRGRTYKLYITLYNPHIENSAERPPQAWIMESFLGEAAPPAVAPNGYALDYAEVAGFKISARAHLEVEEPLERNGSAMPPPMLFTMRFPTLFRPGDQLELRGPPGYNFVDEDEFNDVSERCLSFRYLQVEWPSEEEVEADPELVRPPLRPPLPPDRPPWAFPQAWTQELPLMPPPEYALCTNQTNGTNGTNDSNGSDNESNASNSSCANFTWNETEEFLSAGLSSWALDAAMEAQENVSDGNSSTFLVLKSHCLTGPRLDDDWLSWMTLPAEATLRLVANSSEEAWNASNTTWMPNASAHNRSDLDVLCLSAEWINETRVQELQEMQDACEQKCLARQACVDNMTSCSNLTADALVIGNGTLDGNGNLIGNGTLLPYGFNLSTFVLPTCLNGCPRNETGEVRVERCFRVPKASVPPNSSAAALKIMRSSECAYDCCSALNISRRDCSCGDEGTLLVEVLWRSDYNLTAELEMFRLAYEEAVALRNWDRFPLQTVPTCVGNKMFFDLTADGMHPERELLNGTTLSFMLQYRNPRRPPMWFLNFWALRHEQADFIVSSAAVKSWVVISRLRYLRADLLNEVLKPDDPARIHIEFVTVNPANKVMIHAVSPETFNFEDVFIASSPNETSAEPSLYWRGFTDVQAGEKGPLQVAVHMQADAVQYVRFDLGGVRIPWTGGQAIFHFFSTIRGLPADELQFCCPPGYPALNPGVVFRVPYRFYNIIGSLQNRFMRNRVRYPIAAGMETRLGEDHKLQFIWFLPKTFATAGPWNIILVIRPPVAYLFLPTSRFKVETAAGRSAAEAIGGVAEYVEIPSGIRTLSVTRAELTLGVATMNPDVEYIVTFDVRTPETHALRTDRRLWVMEVTHKTALEQEEASDILGVYDDFDLYSPCNFTVFAPRTPPEVVIEVWVTLIDIGEVAPNRVDVYGPSGYKFLLSCFAPGQEEALRPYFVSCRERWSIWSGNYLSGAVMMTVNGGVPSSTLPMTAKLLVRTPAQTPTTNHWFVRTYNDEGALAWGIQEETFPIVPMDVDVAYAAAANTRVNLSLALRMRTPLPYEGHIHLAAPRLYQMFCPVTKLLRGPMVPLCTQNDPVLTGCFGLPSPRDPNPAPGLPLCDPLHEVLLTFPRHLARNASNDSFYVMDVDDYLFISLGVRVPSETPRPRSENVFRVRLLDESRVILDGKLTEQGSEVIDKPRLEDVELWWERATPRALITVAIKFTFSATFTREEEEPGRRLRVIQIDAPEGLRMAMRRPRDVISLDPESPLRVTEWNWTALLPRGLWFGLDESTNVTGTFHYSFPVLLPGEGELPFNNLWTLRLCADTPFCSEELLNMPVPGFFFGEEPTTQLTEDARSALLGGDAVRRAAPPGFAARGLASVLLAVAALVALGPSAG